MAGIKCIPIPPMSQKDIERFWPKVDRSGGPDACWAWNGTPSRSGYGYFKLGRKNLIPNRIAWTIANGPIPDGIFVCHDCPDGDNPHCVNPKHMFLGTIADNNRDMANKGRAASGDRSGPRLHPEALPRGEANGASRFKEEDIRSIRRAYQRGESQASIARRLDINRGVISRIVNFKSWAHLEDAAAA